MSLSNSDITTDKYRTGKAYRISYRITNIHYIDSTTKPQHEQGFILFHMGRSYRYYSVDGNFYPNIRFVEELGFLFIKTLNYH